MSAALPPATIPVLSAIKKAQIQKNFIETSRSLELFAAIVATPAGKALPSAEYEEFMLKPGSIFQVAHARSEKLHRVGFDFCAKNAAKARSKLTSTTSTTRTDALTAFDDQPK